MSWWDEPSASHAYTLCAISTVVTLLAAAIGFAIYSLTGSSLMLCYSLENYVDLCSSLAGLWRFQLSSSPSSSLSSGKADEAEINAIMMGREKRASVAIAFHLCISGFSMMGVAIQDFTKGMETEHELKIVLYVSLLSMLLLGLLAIMKLHYAILISSATLQKSGLCSLLGAILSTGLFVNSIIIKNIPAAWWIDPAAAWSCSVATILIGLNAIFNAVYVQNLTIWSHKWWFMKTGDEILEQNDPEAMGEHNAMVGRSGKHEIV